MLVGVMGTVLPVVPGVPVVFLGALFYAYLTEFMLVDGSTLVLMLGLTAAAVVAEPAFVAVSARRWGGTRRAIWGALLGGLAGLLLAGPLGLILGIPGGAFTVELLAGRPPDRAGRTAVGAMLGLVGGRLFSLLMALAILMLFLVRVF